MTRREKAAHDRFGRPCRLLSPDEHQVIDRLLGIPEDEEPVLCMDGLSTDGDLELSEDCSGEECELASSLSS